jgi:hypothetical protein
MSFAKPEKKSETYDSSANLYCTHPGCTSLWSVQIDRRLCSYHQWGNAPVQKPKKLPDLKPRTLDQWYDERDEF